VPAILLLTCRAVPRRGSHDKRGRDYINPPSLVGTLARSARISCDIAVDGSDKLQVEAQDHTSAYPLRVVVILGGQEVRRRLDISLADEGSRSTL
jgi:hypothetical protein